MSVIWVSLALLSVLLLNSYRHLILQLPTQRASIQKHSEVGKGNTPD